MGKKQGPLRMRRDWARRTLTNSILVQQCLDFTCFKSMNETSFYRRARKAIANQSSSFNDVEGRTAVIYAAVYLSLQQRMQVSTLSYHFLLPLFHYDLWVEKSGHIHHIFRNRSFICNRIYHLIVPMQSTVDLVANPCCPPSPVATYAGTPFERLLNCHFLSRHFLAVPFSSDPLSVSFIPFTISSSTPGLTIPSSILPSYYLFFPTYHSIFLPVFHPCFQTYNTHLLEAHSIILHHAFLRTFRPQANRKKRYSEGARATPSARLW